MQEQITNEALLAEVKYRLDTNVLDEAAVRAVLVQSSVVEERGWSGNLSLTKLLYVIGAVIASLGIVFFVGQIWDDLGSIGRILITFGLGLLLAWYGSSFMRTKPETYLGDVLHGIAGLLIPGGAIVVLVESGIRFETSWPVIGVFAAVSALYLALLRVFSNSVLVFYAIANTTIAVSMTFSELFPRAETIVYLWYSMVVGLVYMYLAFAFQNAWHRSLSGLLNLFGSMAFYIAAFSCIFQGTYSNGHSGRLWFWELIYPFLAVGGMFASVRVGSRAILLTSSVALIGYITYITAEYFADSIGWPLALVILGFIVIGVGYGSINLSKRYMQKG